MTPKAHLIPQNPLGGASLKWDPIKQEWDCVGANFLDRLVDLWFVVWVHRKPLAQRAAMIARLFLEWPQHESQTADRHQTAGCPDQDFAALEHMATLPPSILNNQLSTSAHKGSVHDFKKT